MSNQPNIKLGVLASGNGSNLQAIIDACKKSEIAANVAVVISDNSDAYAITRADKSGIDAFTLLRKDFNTKSHFEEKIIEILKSHDVDLVCLAGYMRIIGKPFITAFPNRIINIHPALLPSFPGLNAQRQALKHGVKISGCTVHFVDEHVDHGPIILQASVPVLDDDDEETLKTRILEQEHMIYPKAIELFAKNRLKINGTKVYILD